MSERGVFAVDRGIFDHPSFAPEPFTEREAWAWLISEAAWKPHRRRIGKFQVNLVRGQVAASIRFLADKWRWHRSRVDRFLSRLKTETMIETKNETGISVITVCNYNKYQRVSLPAETVNEKPKETPPRHSRDKEEGTEDKKEDSEANASAASAALDPRTQLFRRGLEALALMTGKTPSSCRGLVGLWLKSVNDEAIHVLAAIDDAGTERPIDPVPWIAARLKPRMQENRNAKTPSAIMGAVDEHIRNLESRRDSEIRETPPRLLSHG